MNLRKLLLIAFVFSGMAALIYELTWIRPLQFLLGSTVYTTLMGATFPIIAKFYTQEKIGKGIGEVYSANNLGAIIGSFGAGFILIPLLGIKASIIFAGTLNLLIGFAIISFSNKNLSKKIIPLVLVAFVVLAFLGN